jgi:cytochrome c oxidase subunit 2
MVMGFQPIMPTFQGLISEEGLLQLVAYIKSLSKPSSATGTQLSPPTNSSVPPNKENPR